VLLASLAAMRATNDSAFLAGAWPALARAARWQLAAANATGCPAHLQTTYDYLGLDAYPHVTYNAVLHLAAMRAIVRLAALAGDASTLAADAAASEVRCRATLAAQLWHDDGAGGGWWRAVQTAAGDASNDILSGALHGLSWANFVGLGGGLLPLANVSRHVEAELARNCNYTLAPGGGALPGGGACSLGLLAMPGRGGGWAVAASPAQSMDATAARVFAGVGGLAGGPADGAINLYRDGLRDLWHWMDLHVGPGGLGCGGADLSGAFLAGAPFVNSHYARQLQGWHALIAATGQQADATRGTLAFAPHCASFGDFSRSGGGGGAVDIPFIVPGAVGTVHVDAAHATAAVRVLGGRLADGARVTVDLARCGGGGDVEATVEQPRAVEAAAAARP